ncbi:unnamed protein product [Arctia plantaginis]|uniref:Gustatory receptor n=1 Tax=Arctia plantaginis TaxID=874455 RepID=A0A8S0YNU3_ARCPL|nr:unnamed protein product [Arctia plantaginis]
MNDNNLYISRFKVQCFYGIYNILTLMGQSVLLYFTFHNFFNSEVSLSSVSYVLFYVVNFTAAISLVRLAKCWPKLMKLAEETEQSLTLLKLDGHTIKKSNIIAIVMILTSLVTHSLSTIFIVKLTIECVSNTTSTYLSNEIFESYVKIRMFFIFNHVPYSELKAISAMIFHLQTTILTCYVDILTICCSIYITSYFYNLNKIIYSRKNNSPISWGQLREHYSKLALLVKEIDAQLSSFTLLSFFGDIYFICLQLFTILHKSIANFKFKNCDAVKSNSMLASPEYIIAYYSTFLFLMLRFISLSLFAANVHNIAQKPVIPVYSVQPEEYDQEVERFQLILRFTTVAFSGKLFYVTRNTILQAISTIITYELVLLQFSKTYLEDDSVNNTTSVVDNWD